MTSNPGTGSLMSRAKKSLTPALAGVGGGALAGFVDTIPFFARSAVLSGLAKFGLAVLGGSMLRRRTEAAYGFVGGAMGGLGYTVGVRMGGGLVALTKGQALKGLADLAADDPELEAVIADADGIGDLVTAGDLADADEDMADLVEE